MWFKVDDMLAFNAKVVTVGNEAMGLWVRAGAWCASQLKGGFVPDVMANAMRSPLADGQDIASLVHSGLWHRVDGGYMFHDWDQYQPDPVVERAKRLTRAEAGKRGAQARWGDGNSHSNGNGNRTGNRMANGDATAMPPSSPVQSSPNQVKPEDDPAFAEFWSHYPKKVAKGAAAKAWKAAVRKVDTPQTIIDGVVAYVATCERDGIKRQFIKHPASWLTSECWTDEDEPTQTQRNQPWEGAFA